MRCSSLNQEEARSYPVYRPTALASAKSQRPTCQAWKAPQGPPLIHLTKCPYEQPVKGISTNSGWSARNRRCHSAFTRRSTGHSPQTGSCSRQKGTDLDRRHLHFSWPRCRTASKYPGLPCGSTWLPNLNLSCLLSMRQASAIAVLAAHVGCYLDFDMVRANMSKEHTSTASPVDKRGRTVDKRAVVPMITACGRVESSRASSRASSRVERRGESSVESSRASSRVESSRVGSSRVGSSRVESGRVESGHKTQSIR